MIDASSAPRGPLTTCSVSPIAVLSRPVSQFWHLFVSGSQFSVELRVDVLEHRPLSAHRKKSHQHPRVRPATAVVAHS